MPTNLGVISSMVKRRIKKIKIVEKKLGRHRVWGFCYQGEKLIEIDPRQRAKTYLDTLIHELLHELFPEFSENKVKQSARVLTKHIWEKNYRRIAK
jgi:hypothetical protein